MSLYVQQLNVSIIINYALYLFLHVVAVLFLVVVRASDTRHVLALLVGPRRYITFTNHLEIYLQILSN